MDMESVVLLEFLLVSLVVVVGHTDVELVIGETNEFRVLPNGCHITLNWSHWSRIRDVYETLITLRSLICGSEVSRAEVLDTNELLVFPGSYTFSYATKNTPHQLELFDLCTA
jgi:hypothetical protein